jgi:hypothetical protein
VAGELHAALAAWRERVGAPFPLPPNPEHGSFASSWPDDVDRTWIGPAYWANRLQDWRIRGGRLECVEGGPRFPLRTLHLLTRSTRPAAGTLDLTVTTGPLDADEGTVPPGWSGFLIGAGGDHVDHRLTALVHHRPAADGGLLAVVDATGRVMLRDHARPAGGGGGWSIAGPVEPEDMPVLAAAPDRGAAPAGPVALHLAARPDGPGYRLTLTARAAATGDVLGEVVLDDVPAAQVDGGIALVSHRGAGPGRGFWFRDWRGRGTKLRTHPDRAFGPVLATQYTLGDGVLKLTAQLGPLGADDTPAARLRIATPAGVWRTVATAPIDDDSFTARFRVEGWDAGRDTPYRVVYDLAGGGGRTVRHAYDGIVRAEPVDAGEIVIGSLNCHKVYTGPLRWNHDGVWFPHGELVDAVRHHDPDLLFFAGDQVYEGDLDPAVRAPEDEAVLDYLGKWFRWCWAFGDLTRDRPTVTIPDDHDVYHGNLWGAGGRRARATADMTAQDSGGYVMSPRFVNAVHRTQTGHLPDPRDPDLIGAGYSTYHTTLDYAGVSFAILADRQFKSSPTVRVPEGDVVNGWFRNPDFDPATQSDAPGAVLLGAAQLAMLRAWATDWPDGTWMKVALSQTPFTNVATLPRDAASGAVLPGLPVLPADTPPADHRLAADADSNGWPRSGRDRAVRALRRGAAIHLAGDQHLGSLVEYGLDDWRDAGYVFTAPAIANTWPRRWHPPAPGLHRGPGAPPYTGDFIDGFGNRMTVHAVANPVVSGRRPAALHDRAPGYGIVRLHRATRRITFECWPRWADPTRPDARQYPGWPRTIEQTDNGDVPR